MLVPTAIRSNANTTPEGIQQLAAAILRTAVMDLQSKKHRQDAARFLYSGECEILAGVIGVDYMSFRARLQRTKARRAARNRRTA